jgi:hypothetical protein
MGDPADPADFAGCYHRSKYQIDRGLPDLTRVFSRAQYGHLRSTRLGRGSRPPDGSKYYPPDEGINWVNGNSLAFVNSMR